MVTPVADIVCYRQANILHTHPIEDFCLVGSSGRTFAVADGVTRDAYSKDDFSEDSGAAQVARLFCEKVIDYLENNIACDSASVIGNAFDSANRAIKMFNERAGIPERLDYLENDYFGTVGAVAFLCKRRHLHYGYVGDCRIVVYSSSIRKKLETPDEVMVVTEYLRQNQFQTIEGKRRFVRCSLRNKPAFIDSQGRNVSYGVFTGEPDVASFYRFGRLKTEKGDLIILFSDGFSPLFSYPQLSLIIEAYSQNRDRLDLYNGLAEICANAAQLNPRLFGDDKVAIIVKTD